MTGLVCYFLLAVGVSFLCSLLEAILLSVSQAHIELLIKKGKRSGQQLKRLKEQVDRPLSAILTINTVANTVGAAGVGAQALRLSNDSMIVASVSAGLTFCILVFSEIIPKTIGATYWKKLAPAAAVLIRGLILLTYPIVVSFEGLAWLITHKAVQRQMTREELLASAEISQHEGAILKKENRIIANLLMLDKIPAEAVMTPRAVLLALQTNQKVSEVAIEHNPIRFSRLPVYNKNMDDVVGMVHRFKILTEVSEERDHTPIGKLAAPIHAVPESKSVSSILDEMIQRREQMFLVVDEYGGTAGIITLEDVVETLLGVEIVDEYDTVEDMRKLALEKGAIMRINRLREMR